MTLIGVVGNDEASVGLVPAAVPAGLAPDETPNKHKDEAWPQESADAHLRSCGELVGYHIHALDGDIGHVKDMLVDDHTWAIRYLIINTSNWWGGHLVLVSPQWVDAVSWPDSKVSVGVAPCLLFN